MIRHLKAITIAAALALSLAGGTVALTTAHLYEEASLTDKTNKGIVTNRIDENFDGVKKTDVCVENTGNIDAYVRVAIVPIWRDSDGNATMLPTKETYNMTLNMTDWFLGAEGYYYCQTAVAPGEKTPVLIESCTLSELTEVYADMSLDLQILAQSIQSDPQTAVQTAWGVGIDNFGRLTE